jgi:hypothetical protein
VALGSESDYIIRAHRSRALAMLAMYCLTFGMTKPKPEKTHPNAGAFPGGVGGPVLRALATAGIRSMRGLTRWTERDLAALHGMGPKGVRILNEALAEQGLAFREPPGPSR